MEIKKPRPTIDIDSKTYWDAAKNKKLMINRKKKLPYVTGKLAVSKNNLIYKITYEKAGKWEYRLKNFENKKI